MRERTVRVLLSGVLGLAAALVLLGSAVLPPSQPAYAVATTYYVRKDGNNATCNGKSNASSGSAPSCAFLTIAFAVSQASSGDTIVVRAGTYTELVVLNKTL